MIETPLILFLYYFTVLINNPCYVNYRVIPYFSTSSCKAIIADPFFNHVIIADLE